MAVKAERFITQLFETYVSEPRPAPPTVQSVVESRGIHQAVTDYIVGMTDRFALQEWQRLFDPYDDHKPEQSCSSPYTTSTKSRLSTND